MSVDEAGSDSEWTMEQDKAFENAVATYPEDSLDWWEKIAASVSGKTLEEIKEHYKLLEDDINAIESGCPPLPSFNSSESSAGNAGDEGASKKGTSQLGNFNSESNHGSKNSKSDQDRRKGLLGQRMNTGYFFWVWINTEKVTGETYPGTLWSLERLHKLQVTDKNTSLD